MTQKRLDRFDALVTGYYGKGDTDADPRTRVEELFAGYYGKPVAPAAGRRPYTSQSLSVGSDDGEVMPQSGCRRSRPGMASGATGGAMASATSLDYEEYVIEVCDSSPPAANDTDQQTVPSGGPSAPTSRVSGVAPGNGSPASAGPSTGARDTQIRNAGSGNPDPRVNEPATASSLSVTPAEADILGDLQAIIRGQKVYDKEMGMVDRSSAPRRDNGDSTRNAPLPPAPPPKGQEIFERIAQSMRHANAYDLGTVELENRFADFDRQEDERRKSKGAKTNAPSPAATSPTTPTSSAAALPDTADFLRDLDTIKARRVPSNVSRPFYDTGEHVLAGAGNYPGLLHVGKGNAVALSYGQIIAMGDLYDTVDDLLNADVGELTRLKTLIERDTEFYEGKKANKSLGVKDEVWESATAGRYLKLAENNYEHFSPVMVAMGRSFATWKGDNRSAWERYHREAIEAAQQMMLAANPKTSVLLEVPLIINAFGDHFLTDAFSSGHLINKEAMIQLFKTNFFKGDDLTDPGEEFFEKVASATWKGEVAARFSKLETVDWAHWHGIPLPFHPNIDSASRFGTLLKEAAKQAPDRVANLIVKALHDYLNENGIEVTNRAGDGTWILPGDGSLLVPMNAIKQSDVDKNLRIMRKAVQQSIDDINSPSILVSNIDFQKFFDGVWKYVPELTPSSRSRASTLIHDYSDPRSATLVSAASDILFRQLTNFINILVNDEKKLRPA